MLNIILLLVAMIFCIVSLWFSADKKRTKEWGISLLISFILFMVGGLLW